LEGLGIWDKNWARLFRAAKEHRLYAEWKHSAALNTFGIVCECVISVHNTVCFVVQLYEQDAQQDHPDGGIASGFVLKHSRGIEQHIALHHNSCFRFLEGWKPSDRSIPLSESRLQHASSSFQLG
jgi:hypothetical protein